MKRHLFNWLIAGVAILGIMAAAPSFAASVNVGDIVTFGYATPYSGDNSGGAFAVYKGLKADGNFLFNSFCIERNEYIYVNGTTRFTVTGISDSAENGGVSGAVGNKDPISSVTQYLYYGFITNASFLTGYDQADIQNAIWFEEGEIASLSGDALTLYNSVANVTGDYGVGVMNIVFTQDTGSFKAGQVAQSQLMLVPEPGMLLLLGSGLLGLAGIGRKFRK